MATFTVLGITFEQTLRTTWATARIELRGAHYQAIINGSGGWWAWEVHRNDEVRSNTKPHKSAGAAMRTAANAMRQWEQLDGTLSDEPGMRIGQAWWHWNEQHKAYSTQYAGMSVYLRQRRDGYTAWEIERSGHDGYLGECCNMTLEQACRMAVYQCQLILKST